MATDAPLSKTLRDNDAKVQSHFAWQRGLCPDQPLAFPWDPSLRGHGADPLPFREGENLRQAYSGVLITFCMGGIDHVLHGGPPKTEPILARCPAQRLINGSLLNKVPRL